MSTTITRSTAKKSGNPTLTIGTLVLCRSAAASLLDALVNEPEKLREELEYMTGLHTQAVAERAAKPAKVEAPAKSPVQVEAPAKIASVREGTGAGIVTDAKATRDAGNKSVLESLRERARDLDIAVEPRWNATTLRARITAAEAPKPTAAPTAKPARKVLTRAIGENGLFYTLYSDGTFSVEPAIKSAA